METYRQLKERQHAEIDAILTSSRKDVMLLSAIDSYDEAVNRHEKELAAAMHDPENGKSFYVDALLTELEASESKTLMEAIDRIGLTGEEVIEDPDFKEAYEEACRQLYLKTGATVIY